MEYNFWSEAKRKQTQIKLLKFKDNAAHGKQTSFRLYIIQSNRLSLLTPFFLHFFFNRIHTFIDNQSLHVLEKSAELKVGSNETWKLDIYTASSLGTVCYLSGSTFYFVQLNTSVRQSVSYFSPTQKLSQQKDVSLCVAWLLAAIFITVSC